MALDSFFTGCNDRLETKWFPLAGSCMGFSYGELSNGESQEVEPYVALIVAQGMGQSGFAWLQFQPNALSPRRDELLRFAHPAFLGVKSHKVISLPSCVS